MTADVSSLEREVDEAENGNESADGSSAMPRGTETILLVDDEEGVRELTLRVLRGCGYAVLEAGGGEDALKACSRHRAPIDLLVTDVVMPGMGGRALADQVLNLHPETRVLYLSGYTNESLVRRGILEHDMHFLQKPFGPAALARKVREVLDE